MEIFLIAAVSANGKIAENEGQVSLDWTSKEDLRFFVKKTKDAGVMVMGRKTYETIGRPLPGRLNLVMTRSANNKQNQEGILEYTSSTPTQIISDLKNRGFNKIAVTGGSEIYSLFLQSGLVTDIYLTIEPVLFGEGTPFVSGFDRLNLELIESKQLNDNAVMMHYKIK